MILYVIKFILAFCSIVYELILAQALSAFLENTILRYSVTIGLYMFSMGFGAMLAEGKFLKRPVTSLIKIEMLLTIIGGNIVIIFHLFDIINLSYFAFAILAHFFILFIGLLTGFEIPLIIELINMKRKNCENKIFAVDYMGAFIGTVVFAFIFYPKVGLLTSAFIVGFLNASAGVVLLFQRKLVAEDEQVLIKWMGPVLGALWCLLFVCIMCSGSMSLYFLNQYML